MNTKRLLSIGFVVMLLMSMATVLPFPAQAVDAQAIWVDPASTTGLNMGDTFVVDVKVNVTDPPGAATGMYGFQYKLKWNATALDATIINTHADAAPPGDLPTGWTAVYVAANATGTTAGEEWHSYAVSATAGVAFTGVYSLCTYTFKVMYQPAFPEPDFVGALDIYDDILVDDTATPIPHTTGDGEYTILSVVPEPPKVGILPVAVKGVFGETFNLDIVIEDSHPLFPAWDLYGFEFKLSYNTTVLDALSYVEGAWFTSFAGVNGTYPVVNIDETNGIVHAADLYLDGRSGVPSGSGVLMTIVFNATSMFVVPPGIPPHIYAMDLFDVMLVNSQGGLIDLFGVNDGTYEEPYKVLGWALDCWTDAYRKLNEGNHYYTPFTGIGQSNPGENGVWDVYFDPVTGDWKWGGDDIMYPADCYEPQEFVKLYAKLTYNEWPEQNKIIVFEISGPVNIYDNITIYRTAITDEFGVATINFTIPHPCTNLDEVVMGKWICWQSAQVKDPWNEDRYKKVVDILFWEVGWKVELLNVTVVQPTWPGGNLEITVWKKNIAQVPMHVVFALTVFDTLLDPVGETTVTLDVPAGAYCHPEYDMFTASIPLPKWCHVGPGARVYVNAFTALPSQCGLPYCPEISVAFTISLPP